jgi:hypothetical protein
MATNVDPNIALSAKAPDTMTGLGQIMNIARGAQAYQQNAESFPTLLEQQKLALTRGQQLLPIELRQSEATASQSETKLNADQMQLAGTLVTGLRKVINDGTPEEFNKSVEATKILLSTNKHPQMAQSVIGHVQSLFDKGDKKGALSLLDTIQDQMASNQSKFASSQPQPVAGLNAPASFTPQTNQITPTPIVSGAPPAAGAPPPPPQATAPTVPIAPKAAPSVFTQVAPGVETAPVAAPVPLQGKTLPPVGTPPAAAPTGVTAQQMSMPPEAAALSKPVPLTYPVRNPSQPYAPAMGEAEDTTKNIAYRQGLTARQTDLTSSRRNIQEVIELATKIEKESVLPSTGPIGGLKRKFAELTGDPTYKQLSKDLANIQISNIRAQGGSLDTVGGQQLTRMASGDETYPPEVLIKIARRTDADSTNIDMQATAADRFAKKFGDNNLNAFKQMWSKNADSKVFEAMNIYRDAKDPAEAKKQIDELLGKDTKQRKIFFQKYQNIQKLYENGAL